MRAAAAVMMQILGNIGELGKETERPHHGDCRVMVEPVEDRLEFLLGDRVAVAMKTNSSLADVLDQVKALASRLFLQRVAQQAPKHADVFAQREIFIRVGFSHENLRARKGGAGCRVEDGCYVSVTSSAPSFSTSVTTLSPGFNHTRFSGG